MFWRLERSEVDDLLLGEAANRFRKDQVNRSEHLLGPSKGGAQWKPNR